MRMICVLAALLLMAAQAQPVYADSFISSPCGQGYFNIPDAATGGVPGVLSCPLVVAAPGTIGAGDAVTLSLLGLAHEASGDLVVTLTHFDASGTTPYGSPQYVFYRIGKTSADPADYGYSAQFGSSPGTGDNYSFNSGFAGDLWGAASSLGSADFIPGSAYWTTGPYSGDATSFSSEFAGQPVAGSWLLEISDNAAGPSDPSTEGSLLEWQLTVETTAVPEPGYGGMFAMALAAIAAWRRFRTGASN
jgi:hypothetical protein